MTPQQIIQMLLQSPEALDLLTGMIESFSGQLGQGEKEEDREDVEMEIPEGRPVELSQEDVDFLSESMKNLRNQQGQLAEPSFDPMTQKRVENRGVDAFAERKVEDFLENIMEDTKNVGGDALEFFAEILPSYGDVKYGARDIGRKISSVIPSYGDVKYGARDIGRKVSSVADDVSQFMPSYGDVKYGARDIGRKISSVADDVSQYLIPSPAQAATLMSGKKGSDIDAMAEAVMREPFGEKPSTLPQGPESKDVVLLSSPSRGEDIDVLRENLISARREHFATPKKKRNVRSVLDAMKRYNDALYERDRLI